MAQFDDFEQVYEPLTLPIKGKRYVIPPVEAGAGIRFTAAATGVEGAPFISDTDLRTMLLGPVYDEMVADGVSDAAIQRVMLTALADHQAGRKAAEMMWATGGDPKALTEYVTNHAPNRASRRSKSTGGARKTR